MFFLRKGANRWNSILIANEIVNEIDVGEVAIAGATPVFTMHYIDKIF
jgi:hypothetical protein